MENSQHKRPLILGFVLAVMISPLSTIIQHHQLSVLWSDFQFVALLIAFTLPGIISIAFPLVFFLKSCGWLSWCSAIFAFIIAGISYYQFLAFFLGGLGMKQMLPGMLFGLQSGVGFCLGVWPKYLFKPATRLQSN